MWGPTFQFDTAHIQTNLNVWLEKHIRDTTGGPAVLNYQLQLKSLFRPHLEIGMQGFGSVGEWNHWAAANQQEHSVGPAVFASWPRSTPRFCCARRPHFGFTSMHSAALNEICVLANLLWGLSIRGSHVLGIRDSLWVGS